MALPPLITDEGLVLNSMQPNAGALGGYTPPGTASSEGISLMLRGVLHAAIATNDPAKLTFAKHLFDAACTYFFKNTRPSSIANTPWDHSWIVNAGLPFSVRGPLDPSGDLALSGFVYNRDAEASITVSNGVGQLNPPPVVTYQAVSGDAILVWNNVFADLNQGTRYDVDYYIDADGNKVFGTQKGGSFGQPSIPAGQHSDGAPGKIKLVSNYTGSVGVNYCITVPDVKVQYGELYEAWPMWRKLAENEVSTAADAIHWFIDAFALGMEMEPGNPDWSNAHARMLEVWQETCTQESNNTRIFTAGASGPYNNQALTYGFGFGRRNVDDPDTNWSSVPPTDDFTVERTSDTFVTWTLPEASAEVGSGGNIRYGVSFQNSPLFLDYTGSSTISANMKSSEEMTVKMSIAGTDGKAYEATILVGPTSTVQTIKIGQFMQFQQEPGDATGDKTGDWTDDPDEWEMPDYDAVPFPGRRLMLVGDSITWYNSYYFPPVADRNNRFGYYSFGMAGYWTYADQILGGRLELEHGIQPNIGGIGNGYNVAVAGSRVSEWWDELINPIGIPSPGPMYAALNNLTKYDVVVMLGGTNDLAFNDTAANIILNLKKATTDIAKEGKWVFLMSIFPRSRALLSGYSLAEQKAIQARVDTVNQGIRNWISTQNPPNIWFVDCYEDLLGPNGEDPFGSVSGATATDPDTTGNFLPGLTGICALHDGLHTAAAGAYVAGKKLAAKITEAGVPARVSATTLGPLTLGPNLLPNPNMTFTQFPMVEEYGSDGKPISWNYTRAGWATGLGSHLTVGSSPALHNGFTHGKLPDNWHFYRCTNAEDQVIGAGTGGTFSNFLEYTFSDLVEAYPKLAEYMDNSTWADGCAKVSIITDGGSPAIKIDIDIPQTGNKNEGFVLMSHVPQDQHGPWDNYGYTTPDLGPVHANSVYNAGDILQSEATVKFTRLNGTLHSYRMLINLLGVDTADTTNSTSGAKMSGIGNSHNFWPPSDIDRVRQHPEDKTMLIRSPAVVVPAYSSNENRRYAQYKLEVSFDASAGPVTATIILKNPSVRKVTGGTPL